MMPTQFSVVNFKSIIPTSSLFLYSHFSLKLQTTISKCKKKQRLLLDSKKIVTKLTEAENKTTYTQRFWIFSTHYFYNIKVIISQQTRYIFTLFNLNPSVYSLQYNILIIIKISIRLFQNVTNFVRWSWQRNLMLHETFRMHNKKIVIPL